MRQLYPTARNRPASPGRSSSLTGASTTNQAAKARKDTLRRLSLSRRARLTPEQRADHGAAIAERVLGLEEFAMAETVLAFVSISSEVPTAPLLRAVLEEGRTLLLPYVADDGALRAAPV
ncbi:MAG TPA: 5-formyltetrahydrofolate cyclo-ligase, partial [Actinomycetota bacterium]|nr:5-formyltetrahydrofolate cyclo-ligase [Actinomycetota bacterium]